MPVREVVSARVEPGDHGVSVQVKGVGHAPVVVEGEAGAVAVEELDETLC